MNNTELDDLMQSSDSCNTPPPPQHIAARIYKASRHRSSATSSRRNSLASSSARSTRSSHGGPFSTHIAQHLRRASIIESRKAKAADRNAHAEQVRLRAAMNKAAPRTLLVDSEEKAQAAQQARERYLAQVRANCAAEVRRSKRVAEEQREKRAAEHVKLKTILHERHAQAQRRRDLLEQARGKPSTPKRAYVWKPRTEVEACVCIQRAWRRAQKRASIKAFLKLGLTLEMAQTTSFEDVAARLNADAVISSTGRLLQTHGLLDSPNPAAVRTFLSMFLILGHPAQIFNGEGEQEKFLIEKARILLTRLNAVIEGSSESLIEAYHDYTSQFEGWRSKDSSFMISTMVAQFVELDAIWQSVKDDTSDQVTADYREGIQHNQALVLARLKRLAGPVKAMETVRKAVMAHRKGRDKKTATAKVKPRVVDQVNTVDDLIAAPSASMTDRDDARRIFNASSALPDNRQIIHELAIDKEWRVNIEQREAGREEIIKNLATELQQGLNDGLENVWIPALAESIQSKLCSMLTPNKPFQVMVRDTLDPALVAQQVSQGTFSYHQFFAFMHSILPKLCAPVRDDDVRRLSERPSADPVHQLARICFVLDLLMLDMLNFQLMTVAPTLLKESAEYETRAFARQLDGAFPKHALSWWQRASQALAEGHNVVREEASASEGRDNSASGTDAGVNKIYMQGLVDLVMSSDMPVPEMLQLDVDRFERIRNDLIRIVAISAILLNAKNLLRRDSRSLWKSEAQRMWDLTYTSPVSAYVSIIESRYALPATTKQHLTTFITRVNGEARQKAQSLEASSHPVMKVLMKKLRQHLLLRLSSASAEERQRVSNTAVEVLGSSGMPESVARIAAIVQELQRIAHVDREAHAQWYDQVVQRVSAESSPVL